MMMVFQKVKRMPRVHSKLLILGVAALCVSMLTAMMAPQNGDKVKVFYGQDRNIKFVMSGRAGNLTLLATDQEEGFISANYQKGSGYVRFDRQNQTIECRSRIPYTLNRLSKHIQTVAPVVEAQIPKNAELDVHVNVTSMGLGSLDFTDLNISKFKFDVNYGDVDISFPTQNTSIVRHPAKIHLMTGDLEINGLANLMADKVNINGGIGEISIDFGTRLHKDMEVKIDHDIGAMEVFIPKGTKVLVFGTSRDLAPFGFIKQEKGWQAEVFHERSPTLTLKMKGPLGDLKIHWQ